MRRDLHPVDDDNLRLVGEALCDFSWGRAFDRREFANHVGLLMGNIRSDHAARGLAVVVDRLLGLADWRSGAPEMAEAAFVEILLGDAAFAGFCL